MSLLQKLGVLFTGDASGFNKAAKQVEDALTGIEKKTKDTDDSMRKWLKGTATEVNSFMSLVGRAHSAMAGVFKLAEDGARAASAEVFFRNAGKSLEDYRRATHGLISDAELMKKSNLADSMGLSEDLFKQLANVAHAASVKTGQSFDYMFNSIIVGTARSSRLLLDNLGIIVSVKEANLKYAQALKDSDEGQKYASLSAEQLAEKLDDVQKKAAFAEEVMRKSQGMLDEYAKAGATAAENFDRWKAATDNLRVAIGKLVANGANSPLAQMASYVDRIASKINFIAEFSKMDFDTARSTAGNSLMSGSLMGGAMAALPGGFALAPLISSISGITGAFDGMVDDARRHRYELETEYQRLISNFEYNNLNFETILKYPEIAKQFDDGSIVFKGAIARFIELERMLGNRMGISVAKVEPVTEDKPEETSGGGKTEKAPKIFDPSKFKLLVTDWSKMDDEIEKAKKALADKIALAKRLEDERYISLMQKEEELQEFQKRLAEQRAAAADAQRAEFVNLAGSAVAGDASGFFSQLITMIGAAAGGPAVGAALGSILGPLLAPLDGIADVFDAVVKGAAQLMERGFGPLFETLAPLDDALYGLLVAIGHLIGSAIRPLLTVMTFTVYVLSFAVDLITALGIVISPIIELFTSLASVVVGLVGPLFNLMGIFVDAGDSDILGNLMKGLEAFGNVILDGAIWVNNALVEVFRDLGEWLAQTLGDDFGFGGFGEILSREDFELVAETNERNTDATKQNTSAVRDLIREFRNLPSGYKVNYRIFESTAPVLGGPMMGTRPRVDTLPNWRDNFRLRM